MGVHRRMNWLGQERVEVSHLRLMESAEAADFDALGYAIAKDKSYVLRGLSLNANGIGGSADALLLKVADAQFVNWRASESGSMFLLPLDAADEVLNGGNGRVVGGFTPGATNYISLDVTSIADPNSIDTARFKDADNGNEFTGSVPITRVLDWRIYISTVPFSQATGRLAIAQVVTDATNNAVSLTDSRSLLFRLNALRRVSPLNPSTSYDGLVDPFIGGDKDLFSLRDWMEVVMTRLQDLGGAGNWYDYSEFQPATTTTLGLVQIYSAAADPVNPTVPVVDVSGNVVARGLTRDTVGILTIGQNTNDRGVNLGRDAYSNTFRGDTTFTGYIQANGVRGLLVPTAATDAARYGALLDIHGKEWEVEPDFVAGTGGTSWAGMSDLAVASDLSSMVYVEGTTASGTNMQLKVRRSLDGGKTWSAPTTIQRDVGLGGDMPTAVRAGYENGTYYIVASSSLTSVHCAVWVSTDAGATWTPVVGVGAGYGTIPAVTSGGGYIVVSGATNSGSIYSVVASVALASNPTVWNTYTLYTGAPDEQWIAEASVFSAFRNRFYVFMNVNSSAPRKVAHADVGNMAAWTVVAGVTNFSPEDTCLIACDAGRLVSIRAAGFFSHGLATSDDEGVTWTASASRWSSPMGLLWCSSRIVRVGPAHYMAVLKGCTGNLSTTGILSLMVSTDDGATWKYRGAIPVVGGADAIPTLCANPASPLEPYMLVRTYSDSSDPYASYRATQLWKARPLT